MGKIRGITQPLTLIIALYDDPVEERIIARKTARLKKSRMQQKIFLLLIWSHKNSPFLKDDVTKSAYTYLSGACYIRQDIHARKNQKG